MAGSHVPAVWQVSSAVHVTGVPAQVHAVRAEEFPKQFQQHADVITARALAPLEKLCGYVAPLMQPGTVALLPKGQDVDAELTQATKSWNITADSAPSKTDPRGRILIVRTLAKRS